jgi:hypothetical protein
MKDLTYLKNVIGYAYNIFENRIVNGSDYEKEYQYFTNEYVPSILDGADDEDFYEGLAKRIADANGPDALHYIVGQVLKCELAMVEGDRGAFLSKSSLATALLKEQILRNESNFKKSKQAVAQHFLVTLGLSADWAEHILIARIWRLFVEVPKFDFDGLAEVFYDLEQYEPEASEVSGDDGIDSDNDDDQVVKTEVLDAQGELAEYLTYEYKEGKRSRINFFDAHGKLERFETYQYNQAGLKIRTDFFNAQGVSTGVSNYYYNEAGREIKIEEFDAQGKLINSYNSEPKPKLADSAEKRNVNGIGTVNNRLLARRMLPDLSFDERRRDFLRPKALPRETIITKIHQLRLKAMFTGAQDNVSQAIRIADTLSDRALHKRVSQELLKELPANPSTDAIREFLAGQSLAKSLLQIQIARLYPDNNKIKMVLNDHFCTKLRMPVTKNLHRIRQEEVFIPKKIGEIGVFDLAFQVGIADLLHYTHILNVFDDLENAKMDERKLGTRLPFITTQNIRLALAAITLSTLGAGLYFYGPALSSALTTMAAQGYNYALSTASHTAGIVSQALTNMASNTVLTVSSFVTPYYGVAVNYFETVSANLAQEILRG